jgi:hypothetical protein
VYCTKTRTAVALGFNRRPPPSIPVTFIFARCRPAASCLLLSEHIVLHYSPFTLVRSLAPRLQLF